MGQNSEVTERSEAGSTTKGIRRVQSSDGVNTHSHVPMRDPVLGQNPSRRLLDYVAHAFEGIRADGSVNIGQATNVLVASPLKQVQSCLDAKQRGEVAAFLDDVRERWELGF